MLLTHRVCSTVFTVLIVMSNMANIPMIMNLVTYLHGTMHMDVKDASTTSTNFFGAICFFCFLGAFISDSYIKRFYTMLIFAPIEILVTTSTTQHTICMHHRIEVLHLF